MECSLRGVGLVAIVVGCGLVVACVGERATVDDSPSAGTTSDVAPRVVPSSSPATLDPGGSAPAETSTSVAPAEAVPPQGKTLAGPESMCTSPTAAAPIDLVSAQVRVGETPGWEGTTAEVTITYAGAVPPTVPVLWSLLASNPNGDFVQLGYDELGGQTLEYFWFESPRNGQAMNHNMVGGADTSEAGTIRMVLPAAAVSLLGDVWWWSTAVNVDSEDVDTC